MKPFALSRAKHPTSDETRSGNSDGSHDIIAAYLVISEEYSSLYQPNGTRNSQRTTVTCGFKHSRFDRAPVPISATAA